MRRWAGEETIIKTTFGFNVEGILFPTFMLVSYCRYTFCGNAADCSSTQVIFSDVAQNHSFQRRRFLFCKSRNHLCGSAPTIISNPSLDVHESLTHFSNSSGKMYESFHRSASSRRRSCSGPRLIIPASFPRGHIWDGGSVIYRIIYTPQVPHCSPLASETSMWLSSQTAEEAGGGCVE